MVLFFPRIPVDLWECRPRGGRCSPYGEAVLRAVGGRGELPMPCLSVLLTATQTQARAPHGCGGRSDSQGFG